MGNNAREQKSGTQWSTISLLFKKFLYCVDTNHWCPHYLELLREGQKLVEIPDNKEGLSTAAAMVNNDDQSPASDSQPDETSLNQITMRSKLTCLSSFLSF